MISHYLLPVFPFRYRHMLLSRAPAFGRRQYNKSSTKDSTFLNLFPRTIAFAMMKNSRDEQTNGTIPSAIDKADQVHNIAETQIQSGASNDKTSVYHSLVEDYLTSASDLPSTIEKLFSSFNEPSAVETEPSENYLQNFWYAILDSAKQISFRDTPSHNKLVDLVKAVGNSHITGSSISGEETLELQLLGMCSREEYNDEPGSAMGFLAPEVCPWTNLNYF